MLKIVNHPFVIKYYDEFLYKGSYEDKFCIVMEEITGGDLDNQIRYK